MHLGQKRLRDRFTVALLALAAPACCPGLFTPATTLQTPSGPVTAVLGDGEDFPRFCMPDHGEPIAAATLKDDVDLLVLDRAGESRALLVSEMSWHHVAEGMLGGHPIAVVY